MTSTTFEDMITKATNADINSKTKDAIEWFRSEAYKTQVNAQKIFKEAKDDPDKFTSNITRFHIGRMFLFTYDAKYKNDPKKLPYWDKFPLVFPIEILPDGFLGINLHYLSPVMRAKLMDQLFSILNNKKFDDSTKLQISYSVLKSAGRFKYYKVCIKHYLRDHYKTKFMYIEPKFWFVALFLPTQRWQRATSEQVYKDSAKKINANGRTTGWRKR